MTIPEQQPAVVSAVIATHHRPKLLRRAVSAVLDQTYAGAIECIIVFDGTEPDESLVELAVDAEGPREIIVVRNDRVPGLAGARNTGILAASGAFIAFCDDDDRWLPDKLRQQVETFADARVICSVTGIKVIYGESESLRIPTDTTITLDELVRRRVMEAHPSSVTVRRNALLDEIGLVDEDIPGSYAEDFDWILRAARAGTISAVQAPLVEVLWGQSLFSRNWQTIIDAIDYLVEKHPELRESSDGCARLTGRRAFALAALGRRRESFSDIRRTFRLSASEPRSYAAALVASRLVSAERMLALAHKRGHGI